MGLAAVRLAWWVPSPRIQAELRKIGIEVSDSTVSRYRPPRLSPPSQTLRSFLENHLRDIVAMDLFVDPTATFQVLYVLLIMSHDRRPGTSCATATASSAAASSGTSSRWASRKSSRPQVRRGRIRRRCKWRDEPLSVLRSGSSCAQVSDSPARGRTLLPTVTPFTPCPLPCPDLQCLQPRTPVGLPSPQPHPARSTP